MIAKFRSYYNLVPPYLRFRVRKIVARVVARKVDCSFSRGSKRPLSEGVNIIGLPFKYSGISKQLRYLALDYMEQGIPISIYDFENGTVIPDGDVLSSYVSKDLPYKTNIWCFNFHNMVFAYHEIGKDAFANRYNIGYFPWELDVIDNDDMGNFKLCDEIWGVSDFVTNVIKKYTDLPCNTVNIPVKLVESDLLPREYFGLDNGRKIFLTLFDLNSSIYRKNPIVAIQLFKYNFPLVENKDVELILKTRPQKFTSKYIALLQKEIGSDPRIRVMSENMSEKEVVSLMSVCDCLLSPHRSEGYGLHLHEALLLGKKVIATGYSGNLDFMQREEFCEQIFFLNYHLTAVHKGQYFILRDDAYWAKVDDDISFKDFV